MLKSLDFTDLYLQSDIEASRMRGLGGDTRLLPPPADLLHELKQLFRVVDQQRQNAPGIAEFAVPFDDVMYRVAVIEDVRGRVYALRKGSSRIPPLSECGIHPAIIAHLTGLSEGLVLFAGGFGAGKTTAASSFVRDYTMQGALSISLEDPPELPLSGDHGKGRCLQVQVNRKNIDEEVEATLRMAFDLLFISEIRTPSMAKEAINASINGKLIVSTLHADSPVNAVTRLASLGSDGMHGQASERVMRDMLGSGLAAVVYMSKLPDGRRAATDYLLGGPDVRAKIAANEIAGLQNSVNMLRNRLSMNMPLVSSGTASLVSR
jgi:twitching motility protein PilT